MLKIVVTEQWMHPHFSGGHRRKETRFLMSEGKLAEELFHKLCGDGDKISGYSHASIRIIET